MDTWTEIEDTYLTNEPTIWVRGKRVPDPDVEPTEAWLFVYRCTRKPRGISRKRDMLTFKASGREALEQMVDDFISRDDVLFIGDQRSPLEYARYRGEPQVLKV